MSAAARKKLKKRIVKLKRAVLGRAAKKRVVKYSTLLILVGLSCLFLALSSIYKYLNQNYAWAVEKSSYPTGTGTVTMAYAVKDGERLNEIRYIIFDKSNQRVFIYDMSPDMVFDVPGGFGYEKIGTLPLLATLKGENSEEKLTELLRNTLLGIFSYNVDHYIVVQNKVSVEFNRFFIEGNSLKALNPAFIHDVRSSVSTDLTLKDLYEFSTLINGLPEDRVYKIAVDGSGAILEEMSDLSMDSVLARERKSIAVLNGTPLSGIAGRTAKIVENMGGSVIAVGNTVRKFETSSLIVDDLDSASALFLKQVFGISVVESKDTTQLYDVSEVDRADMTLIIGVDIANKLY
ncbi:hypothetical protein A3K34_01005 [candidate division WWE3 bacterium RIFOXYC1_FULL_40_10]|uniref:LytR/CpsA/Psr regulator C-terminal domain-containing protein n=1 Tax=candidate division WWE3 bacterium RIFOXYA2_FULL_46_9 TaxID=1802636 RepID=A0A1F4W2W5_UNCKA|nr:MAG: hypothetical protein A3K58_01005 [candidate division WWE3 bacterium RIFOXYB1_FULL_40_22]OGC61449.1 MAG: hypothetical protein A3K37_01005 [candidate division WWE3 bacterium RIFOXYA1_FULL_40_11]OGC63383.1 MAG: hypothetical protein A2264_01480 [candidate division WWE3 bacterium RIFOXYA2_FULL_46_9]OGC64451.1 MAG: hypothetical protein A2326_00280 [candidate division WWE3 bacterium RIFOXYB2_FULL_41_6]OGC65832.1 MAG: hypothetical protein A3K34_01005 [candidate division WWE3 bacterium RIFOXYC1_